MVDLISLKCKPVSWKCGQVSWKCDLVSWKCDPGSLKMRPSFPKYVTQFPKKETWFPERSSHFPWETRSHFWETGSYFKETESNFQKKGWNFLKNQVMLSVNWVTKYLLIIILDEILGCSGPWHHQSQNRFPSPSKYFPRNWVIFLGNQVTFFGDHQFLVISGGLKFQILLTCESYNMP